MEIIIIIIKWNFKTNKKLKKNNLKKCDLSKLFF